MKTKYPINAHVNVTRSYGGRNITVCSFQQNLRKCQTTRTSSERYNCTCGAGTEVATRGVKKYIVTIRREDVVDGALWYCAASERAKSNYLKIRVNCK